MKIIVNSNPRTGTTYLVDMLRYSAGHHMDPTKRGEYSNTDSWIIKCHEPLLLLAEIPDVSQITIIRNPLDTISSNMFRHTTGLNSNSIWGTTGVSSENKTNNYKDPRFLNGLEQSISKWQEYAENTIKNKDRLTAVSFDYMVNNTADFIKLVFKNQKADMLTVDSVSNEFIEMHKNIMEKSMASNQNHVNGSDNRLPVTKPDEYYEVRNAISEEIDKSGLLDLYNQLVEQIQ